MSVRGTKDFLRHIESATHNPLCIIARLRYPNCAASLRKHARTLSNTARSALSSPKYNDVFLTLHINQYSTHQSVIAEMKEMKEEVPHFLRAKAKKGLNVTTQINCFCTGVSIFPAKSLRSLEKTSRVSASVFVKPRSPPLSAEEENPRTDRLACTTLLCNCLANIPFEERVSIFAADLEFSLRVSASLSPALMNADHCLVHPTRLRIQLQRTERKLRALR